MRLPGSCAKRVREGLLEVSVRVSLGLKDIVVEPRCGLITTSKGVEP